MSGSLVQPSSLIHAIWKTESIGLIGLGSVKLQGQLNPLRNKNQNKMTFVHKVDAQRINMFQSKSCTKFPEYNYNRNTTTFKIIEGLKDEPIGDHCPELETVKGISGACSSLFGCSICLDCIQRPLIHTGHAQICGLLSFFYHCLFYLARRKL